MLPAAHPHPEIPKVPHPPPRAFDRERTKIVILRPSGDVKKNFLAVQPYDKKVEAIPPASNKNQTTNQLACERQTYLLAHRAEATNQLTESMYREDTETDKFH